MIAVPSDRRIADLRVRRLIAPWVDPPRWSPTYDRQRELLVVEVETAGGLVGMGYLQLLAGGSATVAACLDELIRPHLIGRDATEVEAIWGDLWRANYWIGRMGVTVFAQSAVDVALWDLTAKLAGLPLFRLWGGASRQLPAYGSGCWRGLGGDGMVAKAQAYAARGFQAHHEFPYASTRGRGVYRMVCDTHRIQIITVASALLFGRWTKMTARVCLMKLVVSAYGGAVGHFYAHGGGGSRPRWVKVMQKAHLLLPPKHHVGGHHVAPHGINFGIVNGWSNRVLNGALNDKTPR